MKSLLVASDLSPRSDRAVGRAAALASQLGARLNVLHVVDDELPTMVADRHKIEAEAALDGQIAALASVEADMVTRCVVFGTPYRDILSQAETVGAELVVLGTHREDSIGGFFLGTTAERVIRHGDDPVLVVRNHARAPYRRVLIAVDFSVYSRRAVEFALRFVPEGKFFLLHAYDVPFSSYRSRNASGSQDSKRHQVQMDAMLSDEFQAFQQSLPAQRPNLEPVFVEGDVRSVIAEQVGALGADLLVVGTHGRTGLAHALLGSVAEHILAHPPCDVVAVKAW